MASKPTPPKAFVSYSWTDPEHEARIVAWAERLIGDGVDVVLDKWDLREGQDKYAFMEQMVTNPEVSKVIVFSDARYASKADSREGGVGTESQIISKQVYEKVDQKKFIPVVCGISPEGTPCLPTFLSSRIYVDFSSPEKVNEEWDKLLRAIFDKPLFKKPALGKPPTHIFDESGVASRSKGKSLAVRDALLNDMSSFRGLLTDFLETYLDGMEDYRIDVSTDKRELDELVVESIEKFLPARDEFVELTLLIASFRTEPDLYDRLGDFFESTLRYHWRPEEMTSYNEAWFENFRFITYELFLYHIAALLKHRRFQQVDSLLRRPFLLPATATGSHRNVNWFTVFRPGMSVLRHRKERLKLNRLDLTADLIKQRATSKQLPFATILQADLVLFVASMLEETNRHSGYPRTLVYGQYGQVCELFARATSTKGFENLKLIFGVASKDEFLTGLKAGIERHNVGRWSELLVYSDVSFDQLLNLDNLATTP